MDINLSTIYGGLVLKNPIVVGACNIATDPSNLLKLQQAGAAAIVYKSLFEEQIELEAFSMEEKMEAFQGWDAEHESFFPQVKHAGPADHLRQLREARKILNIPLIGSLNCIHDDTWVQYAKEMEGTGIDGLELNFYANQTVFDAESASIELNQIQLLRQVRKAVKIPVFVKLSPFYTNTLRLIRQMDQVGTSGFILFNRLFQPDIDVDKGVHFYPYNFSSENDSRLALRYAGLLHKKIHGTIIANTGIMTGKDVAKMLLAGADATQVVSAIYKKGIHHISNMLEELQAWMRKNNYSTIEAFKGKLSKENQPDPFAYSRAQYVDILMKSDVFMQYHPKHGELPSEFHDDL